MKSNMILSLAFVLYSNLTLASTNVEILTALYERGEEPADVTDFGTIDFVTQQTIVPATKTCAILDDGDNSSPFLIANVRRNVPQNGPLLPGRQEEKLVFGNYTMGYEYVAEPSNVCKDLVAVNPVFRTWIDGSNGTTRFISAHLYARRSSKYIAFRLVVDQSVPGFQREEYYGYCYENGMHLF